MAELANNKNHTAKQFYTEARHRGPFQHADGVGWRKRGVRSFNILKGIKGKVLNGPMRFKWGLMGIGMTKFRAIKDTTFSK